jgi:hydroxymethylpyrimidine/phosphomethylpyrimidine kinase
MLAVLTIAGSDSIAGAGIQADLKTFAALGVYGTSAVTAVTSQNTSGIRGMFTAPPEMVRSQIECVAHDIALSAVKTGMLATADIVRVVAETIGRMERPNLVVDPVMVASSPGHRTLLAPDAVEILKTRLLRVATVVTPNISEAGVLSGIGVHSLDTVGEAAKRIFDLGPLAVVVKGGHLEGRDAVDVLYDGRTLTEFSAPRFSLERIHGTGCAFASAIAAGLALGDELPAAVQRAKTYVTGAIEHSFEVGTGVRLLNHFWIYTDSRAQL